MKKLILVWMIAGFWGCAPAEIVLDPAFTNIEPYRVTGRSMVGIKKTMNIGPYRIGDIKLGWVSSKEDVDGDYSARQKSRFSISREGERWVSDIQQSLDELPEELIRRFQLHQDYGNLVAGRVYNGEQLLGDWVIVNAGGYRGMEPELVGILQTKSDGLLLISEVTELTNKRYQAMMLEDYGFTVRDSEGVKIAVAELVDKGRLWIKPGLANDSAVPILAIFTSLILRQDMTPIE